MQFGFPRDRQLRYADFTRLRPAQKRGRAAMYLKLATLYTKYCRMYRPKFFRTVAMVAAVLGAGAVMQSAHMMPDWIPVWFLGVLAWNHSVVRAPDLHPNVLVFLRDAGATTASSIPADLLRDKGPLLMLIWVVTGYMSGEWLSLNAGMTGFILMTFFVSTFRIIRMMNGNLEAFELVGEKVMEIAEDARAELAAQAREEQAWREDEGS